MKCKAEDFRLFFMCCFKRFRVFGPIFPKFPQSRVVGSSQKSIRKKPARRIQNNRENINWYSCYGLNKAGQCHLFLVFFIILLSWPEWFRCCFVTRCNILSKITQKLAQTEAQPNTVTFFPKKVFENLSCWWAICDQTLFYTSLDI